MESKTILETDAQKQYLTLFNIKKNHRIGFTINCVLAGKLASKEEMNSNQFHKHQAAIMLTCHLLFIVLFKNAVASSENVINNGKKIE